MKNWGDVSGPHLRSLLRGLSFIFPNGNKIFKILSQTISQRVKERSNKDAFPGHYLAFTICLLFRAMFWNLLLYGVLKGASMKRELLFINSSLYVGIYWHAITVVGLGHLIPQGFLVLLHRESRELSELHRPESTRLFHPLQGSKSAEPYISVGITSHPP